MTRRGWLAAGLTALVVGMSCRDSTGPGDRTVVVQLAEAPGDDGALVFKVLASGQETIDTVVTACSACRLFSRRVSDAEVRVIVTGVVSLGPLARVRVSNPVPEAYTAVAIEGASRGYEFRPGVEYALTLVR